MAKFKTVKEITDWMEANCCAEDLEAVKRTEDQWQLYQFRFNPRNEGRLIRNNFSFWENGHEALYEDANQVAKKLSMKLDFDEEGLVYPDSISHVIIVSLWHELRNKRTLWDLIPKEEKKG